MKRIAVIDLGSNSVRMSIFDKNGTALSTHRSIIRLSEGMAADMCLRAEAQLRAAMMLKKYKEIIDAEGIEDYRAVATAAVRKAKNRDEFLGLVRDMAGIEITVIDGNEEAQLDCLAVNHYLNCKKGIICDIGGGSTELIGISPDKSAPVISIPYGSRGICEMFFKEGENARAIQKAQDFSDKLFEEADWAADFRGETLVGIGGTLRAMAKLDLADFKKTAVEGYEVLPQHMSKLISIVENADLEHRRQMPGIGERADIILGGLILTKSVLKVVRPKMIAVADVGVREGLFLQTVNE